jgi:hypothetical protein
MCITLGAFVPAHIAAAVALSVQAGWPRRSEDWAMVLAVSQGIVVLEGEHVVGTAMVKPFGTGAAAISMVIVDVARRGPDAGIPAANPGSPPRRRAFHCMKSSASAPSALSCSIRASSRRTRMRTMSRGAARSRKRPVPQWIARRAAWIVPGCLRRCSRKVVSRFADDVGAPRALLSCGGSGAARWPARWSLKPRRMRGKLSFVLGEGQGAFLRVDTPEPVTLGSWLTEQGLVQVGSGIVIRRNPAQETACRFHSFALANQALG